MFSLVHHSLRIGAATLLAFAAPSARAAHPLATEDTGTQGQGNVELEIGQALTLDAGASLYLLRPQLSYGAGSTLDLIIQPSWLSDRGADGDHYRGFGDTNLDFKWRYFGSEPLSLGIRAGIELPTARQGLGLATPGSSPHAVLVGTIEMQPIVVHANIGWARERPAPGVRMSLWHSSTAVMWSATDRLTLTAEFATDSNPDAAVSRRLAGALAGAIFTLRPGLDLDFGYLTGMRSTDIDRQWLAGITFRWAP